MQKQTALPDGSATERVYLLIRDRRYPEAAAVVQALLQRQAELGCARPGHPLLALLGYCLYMMGDFEGSAQIYHQLHEAFPAVAEYEVRRTKKLNFHLPPTIPYARNTRLFLAFHSICPSHIP